MDPIRIDGSHGEGGGQVLRTAIGLSARTGRAVVVDDVRAGRPSPGLRAQHVAAIDAVAQACDAKVDGAVVGSMRVRFDPGPLHGGEVRVDTGTAGSTTLILHALAAAAPALSMPLILDACGGTDTAWAPTLLHATRVFVPLAARCGVRIEVLEARTGFYPQGGGRLKVRLHPRDATAALPVKGVPERGGLGSIELEVRQARLPDHVGERIAHAAAQVLEGEGHKVRTTIEHIDAMDAGVVVDALAVFDHTVLGANVLGKRGLPSEAIGQRCGEALLGELGSAATVDEHAADQLIPLLAGVDGASFVVRELTGHLRTNLDVAAMFVGERARVEASDAAWRVSF